MCHIINMNILEELNLESLETLSPEKLAEETKKKARVAREVKKATAPKKSKTAIKKRDRLMKYGLLSHSARELHKQNLCGGCRLPKKYCQCGRPLTMNEQMLEKFEIAFKLGMNVEEACGQMGISTNTYYEFERSHLEWRELRMGWQSEPERAARKKIVEEIPRDIKVAQWYAEKKLRSEFGKEEEGSGRPSQVKINLIGMYQIDESGKVQPQRVQAEVVEEVPFLIDQTPQENETEETKSINEQEIRD